MLKVLDYNGEQIPTRDKWAFVAEAMEWVQKNWATREKERKHQEDLEVQKMQGKQAEAVTQENLHCDFCGEVHI